MIPILFRSSIEAVLGRTVPTIGEDEDAQVFLHLYCPTLSDWVRAKQFSIYFESCRKMAEELLKIVRAEADESRKDSAALLTQLIHLLLGRRSLTTPVFHKPQPESDILPSAHPPGGKTDLYVPVC